MALDAFLTVPGLKGSARQKTREGKSHVIAASHHIERTDDGLVHRPFTVRKPLDAMSPGLANALADGTPFKGMVMIEHWRMPPGGGVEENYYTVYLQGAKVVGIKLTMPYIKMEATSQLAEYEEVSFAYENISWRYKADKEAESKSTPMPAKEFMADEEAMIVKFFGDKAKDFAKDIGAAVAVAVKGQIKDASGAPPAAPGGN